MNVFALERDSDASRLHRNLFEIECPPDRGGWRDFPRIDRAAGSTAEARLRIHPGQVVFLDELQRALSSDPMADGWLRGSPDRSCVRNS
jgi:predicted NUDIX family NTP pyrophosphohydrolase